MNDGRGVRNRLLFAKKRLDELNVMGGGDFGIVSEAERQQPIQEFLFHLVGAVEFLAQTINDEKGLGLNEEDVTPNRVCKMLPATDPIRAILSRVHPNTGGHPLPKDPYSEDGSFFRIILLRNRVCHHGRNPFLFRAGSTSEPSCSFFLDPRLRGTGSSKSAIQELKLFWDLINRKCEEILST